MTLTVILASSAALLVLAAFGVALHREPAGRIVVYGGSLAISAVVLVAALAHLLGAGPSETTTLPVGLPWLHARFQLDALAAFFLAVVNLGAALASLYALGYGKHEQAPQRVLPFYPLFLAGMTLVVVADDAFTFLFTWEFMSLSSWALVMAHDEVPREPARGLRLSRDGELRHAVPAARLRPARRPGRAIRFQRDARERPPPPARARSF